MAERVTVRELDDDEGGRPLQGIRRVSGPVVTWQRAQTVLLSTQDTPAARITRERVAERCTADGPAVLLTVGSVMGASGSGGRIHKRGQHQTSDRVAQAGMMSLETGAA